MSARDETAIQALSVAGAFCGECGFEPGNRGCPDCERTWVSYVKALRAAGWAPRTETEQHVRAEALREAADAVAENLQDTPEYGEYVARYLRRMADEAAST